MIAESNGDFKFWVKHNHYSTVNYYWSIFNLESPMFTSEKECQDHAMCWLMESHVALLAKVRRLEAKIMLTGAE